MNDEKAALRSTDEHNAGPIRASNGQGNSPWWQPWKQGLHLASQLVIATPLGLPAKVVQAAKYLNLLLGVWDSLEQQQKEDAGNNQRDAS
ncbi:hypothetical protein [Olivibacter sp. XZL3]|uniref:hypothetical protein n=1 Tax=Olivibacter sp. XZL3 TaxID=1735116 RepID=UPI00106619E5|nr:hypothetical protein [Olivibacter sp. XZL3]